MAALKMEAELSSETFLHNNKTTLYPNMERHSLQYPVVCAFAMFVFVTKVSYRQWRENDKNMVMFISHVVKWVAEFVLYEFGL
jgi:hypothetical protein